MLFLEFFLMKPPRDRLSDRKGKPPDPLVHDS